VILRENKTGSVILCEVSIMLDVQFKDERKEKKYSGVGM
jgi:hypothetical protein